MENAHHTAPNNVLSAPPEEHAIPKTVPALLAAARSISGLSDFGDMHFVTGLSCLVDSLQREAQLSKLGEQFAYGGFVNQLVNRLRYVRDVKLHPEILSQRIVKPIIILGLARTGTTKLQRLLCADPNTQSPTYWRLFNPAPFPDEQPGDPSPRIEAAKAAVAALNSLSPGSIARHPTNALEADEEIFLMRGTFETAVDWLVTRTPTFYEYFMNCDQRPQYRFLHQHLQYLQWQEGASENRPWILKSPCHTGFLDTLLEVFPDAVLVHCHRDVATAMPSVCGLIEEYRLLHSDTVDLKLLGADLLDYFGRMMDRYLVIRDQLPPNRILDVQFSDVMNDPFGVVRRVYQHAGRSLSPEAEKAIRHYEASRPHESQGTYSYTLARYGYTKELLDARFAEYSRRFVKPN